MPNLCPQYVAKLTEIQTLRTQFTQEVDSFSNYQALDRESQMNKFIKLFNLRSQLRSLIKELNKELNTISLEQAEKLIGTENFFGPAEIKLAFNFEQEIHPRQIPEIGFTKEQLERAEKNHFLVLRIAETPDGESLTMKKILGLKKNKTKDNGKLLYNTDGYQNEEFFTDQPLKLSWALVTREVVKNITNKNYLQQYEVLINYLINKVFKNQPLPKEYQEAITEFNQKKADIEANLTANWQVAAETLADLKITKLLRRTPAEILYDLVVTADGKQPNGKKLLVSKYDWSSSRYSVGRFVYVGNLESNGAGVDGNAPGRTFGSLGACLSRRSVDL